MIRSLSYTLLAILIVAGFGLDIEGFQNIAYALVWSLLALSILALSGDIIESLAAKPEPEGFPGWLKFINCVSFLALIFSGAWWTAIAFAGHFLFMVVVLAAVDEAKAMAKATSERKGA